MPKHKPLTYLEVVRILKNLGFVPDVQGSTSHQTWTRTCDGKSYAVTVAFHGKNLPFRPGTLNSIIRQSGYTKAEFYRTNREKEVVY